MPEHLVNLYSETYASRLTLLVKKVCTRFGAETSQDVVHVIRIASQLNSQQGEALMMQLHEVLAAPELNELQFLTILKDMASEFARRDGNEEFASRYAVSKGDEAQTKKILSDVAERIAEKKPVVFRPLVSKEVWERQATEFEKNRTRYDLSRALIHDVQSLLTKVKLRATMLVSYLQPVVETTASADELELQEYIAAFRFAVGRFKSIGESLAALSDFNSFASYHSPRVISEESGYVEYDDNSLPLAFAQPQAPESLQTMSTFLQLQREMLHYSDVVPTDKVKVEKNPVLSLYLDEVIYYLDRVTEQLNEIRGSFSALRNLAEYLPKLAQFMPPIVYAALQKMDVAGSVEIFGRYIASIRKLATEGKQINVIEDEVEASEFDVLQLVAEVANKINSQTWDSAPVISVESEVETQMVFLGKQLLEIVLTNVLSNAVKYGVRFDEQGQVHQEPVQVTVRCTEENIRIEVIDHGIGLDPRELRKFQSVVAPGRQMNAVASNIEGTGFGLFLSRLCLQKIGATLEIASDGLQQGSRFTVVLLRQGSSAV